MGAIGQRAVPFSVLDAGLDGVGWTSRIPHRRLLLPTVAVYRSLTGLFDRCRLSNSPIIKF